MARAAESVKFMNHWVLRVVLRRDRFGRWRLHGVSIHGLTCIATSFFFKNFRGCLGGGAARGGEEVGVTGKGLREGVVGRLRYLR